MAYLKPPWITKHIFNPIAMKLGMGGAATLSIPGRTSGETKSVPVIPVDYKRKTYIVSTRGDSEWVRNLRSAGKGTLKTKKGERPFRAKEVPVDQRQPIIDAYLQKAGRSASGYFKHLPNPEDHPVFRLDLP
jgi:hypothetical protein